MTLSPSFLRRLCFAALVWLLLTGDAVIKCSSDPGNLGSGNRPPVAADSFYTVAENGTLSGFMQATDPDGDSLRYRVVAGPGIGRLEDVSSSTGRFTYLPGGIGTDSFSFTASDGFLESNTGVVTIQVIEAQTGGSAEKPSRANRVAVDPLVPGALLVLWSDGTLQRIYRGPPTESETLARRLIALDIDPLAPGRMKAVATDGRQLETDDGGRRWRPAIPNAGNGTAGACGPDPAAMVERCPQLPPRIRPVTDSGAPGFGAGARVYSVLPDPYRAGGWWLAVTGESTELLHTADDGLHWRPVLELAVPDLRMTLCGQGEVCLLDAGGVHLWRVPAGD